MILLCDVVVVPHPFAFQHLDLILPLVVLIIQWIVVLLYYYINGNWRCIYLEYDLLHPLIVEQTGVHDSGNVGATLLSRK